MRRKLFFKISLLVSAIILIIGVPVYFLYFKKPVKYIVYTGRFLTKGHLDTMQTRFFTDYVDRLNKRNGKYNIKLLIYNTRGVPEVCDSIYAVIAKNKDILFSIDNNWGVDIAVAQNTIKKNNLPVFFINADKNNLDFGKGAIFIGNDDNIPNDLLNFLKKVRKNNAVNFVSESDYLLQQSFFKSFVDNQISISDTILVTRNNFTKTEKDRIDSTLKRIYKTNKSTLPLVVNTHSDWGEYIIHYAEKELTNVKIIGGPYILQLRNLSNFGEKSNNELVIASEPTDALSKKILDNLNFFQKKYGADFRSSDAYFIKRCLTVVEIASLFLKKQPLHVTNSTSAAQLFDSLKNKMIRGNEDLYPIDSKGILTREISFTNYKDGSLYSLPTQYNPKGGIIPNIVFGLDIIDIHDIDINANTFAGDFFYWMKTDISHDDSDHSITLRNIKQDESSKTLVTEKKENNIVYRLYRVSGIFYNEYNFARYPFDKQQVVIQVDILKPANDLKISFDERSLKKDSKLFDKFNVPGWTKLDYAYTVDNKLSESEMASTENDNEDVKLYKTLNYRLNLERKTTKPVLEIILPLLFMGLSTILVLFVKDLSFGNVGEVCVGTLLAIITFSIALSVNVPSSDYLTKADELYYVTFFAILFCFATVIYINSKYSEHTARTINITKLKFAILFFYIITFTVLIFI